MLEFSDDIYDSLVEPLKKNRTFSKLVVSLINGYIEDGYIRAYVDDTLSNLKKAAVDSFNSSIDSMSESLSNMGLFTDELNSVSSSAKTKFTEKYNEASKGVKPESRVDSKGDIDKINKRIDDMQEDVNAKLSTLIDLISSLKMGSVPVKKDVENVITDVSNVKSDVENVIPDIPSVKNSVENVIPDVSNVKSDVENVEITDTEQEKEALDFMSNLLNGNSFEF
jgi:hypothetical protein